MATMTSPPTSSTLESSSTVVVDLGVPVDVVVPTLRHEVVGFRRSSPISASDTSARIVASRSSIRSPYPFVRGGSDRRSRSRTVPRTVRSPSTGRARRSTRIAAGRRMMAQLVAPANESPSFGITSEPSPGKRPPRSSLDELRRSPVRRRPTRRASPLLTGAGATPEVRPGLAADVVGGDQPKLGVGFEQRNGSLVMPVAPIAVGHPERGVDEDHP